MEATRPWTKERQAVWRRIFCAWEEKRWPLDKAAKQRIYNYSFFRNLAHDARDASRPKKARFSRLSRISSTRVVSDDDIEDEGESEVDELDEEKNDHEEVDDEDNGAPDDHDHDDAPPDDPQGTWPQPSTESTVPSTASRPGPTRSQPPTPVPGPVTRIYRVSDANLLFTTIELPGFRASDIAVSYHKGDIVVIAPAGSASAQMRERYSRQNHDDVDWLLQEHTPQPIYKRIPLSRGVDPNEIKASLEHGILIIQSPLENDYHFPIFISEPAS
ncbi:hypothetical protein ONZ45_g9564 [Pleurotus djamor]|nr:hypothetical protein ONZ45_g9564 [Pleurotus djamor]